MTSALPTKFATIRPHQLQAVNEIVAAFQDVPVVFLDAPVGSGKTLIAELVRQRLDVDGLYVCSDKALQAQFMGDFGAYAKMVQGRSNYPTENGGDQRDRWGNLVKSADDCNSQTTDGSDCWHCNGYATCPYRMARQDAADAELAVLNTSYLLAEASGHKSLFGGSNKRQLVVVDEADVLEDALLGYVQFEVPQWIGQALKLDYPRKGAHKPTISAWLRDLSSQLSKYLDDGKARDAKQKRRLRMFKTECAFIAGELDKDQDQDSDETGSWLRDYDTKTLLLKPVLVGPYGTRALWKNGRRWLLMSGTIISSDEMAETLGLPHEYATVKVPMTFPVENRPIIVAPIANVTNKSTADDYDDLKYAIERICAEHSGERVLVHTVSKFLAEKLASECVLTGRNVCSYGSAAGKRTALQDYMSDSNSVLFAQSMDRGVDLPGDACRVVVIAKSPFPSFGDRRVSARVHLPGGQSWYAVQTVRKIVQMTGRGVRHDEDYAVSYILDKQFAVNVYAKSKHLFPEYWREAVDGSLDVRWLMRKYADRQMPTRGAGS